jgi:hypothetical protein
VALMARRHPLLNVRTILFRKVRTDTPSRRAAAAHGYERAFQEEIPFDVSQGRADQPFNGTAARHRGNRSVRRHASHCATPVDNAHRDRHQSTTRRLMISKRAREGKAETPEADDLPVGLLAVDPISEFPSSQPARDVRDDQVTYRKFCRGEMRPRPRLMLGVAGGGSRAGHGSTRLALPAVPKTNQGTLRLFMLG